jgi:hypothetical protein
MRGARSDGKRSEGERDRGGEKAGGDARSVFGSRGGDDEFGGRIGRRAMGERVCVDGIGREAPSLNLLRDALSVWRGKSAELGGGAKGRW